MRWSGFLLGGLAGVAAAAYFAKKRPGMFAFATSAASNMWNGTARKVMNTTTSRNLAHTAVEVAPNFSADSAINSDKDWRTVEQLLDSDPEVKAQLEEIRAEAKPH